MTDEMKRDIEWLRSLKEGGHCGEGTLERRLRAQHNDRIDRLVAALSAPSSPGDGWVMVPREPTDEMLLKGHHQIDWWRDDQPTNTNDDPLQKPGGVGTTCKEDLLDAYRAMLSAAPSPGGDQ